MAWQRWNASSHIFEISTDNGANWNPLPLDAAILTEGSLSAALLGAAWPIGSVFISTVSTNPATLLGFGTWTAFGTGRTLVGIDTGQTEFDTVEETGGEKTHVLTTGEIPSHNHGVTDPGHSHTVNVFDSVGAGAQAGRATGSSVGTPATGSATTGITIQNAGGGGAHNNLPPYIVVYMWKRTA